MSLLSDTGKIVNNMKYRAEKAVFDSAVYNWSLGWGDSRKDRNNGFVVAISSPLSGNAEKGRMLCEGQFELEGDFMNIYGNCWEPVGIEDCWMVNMHGFSWLRDLRSLGGDTGRHAARAYVHNWIENNSKWSEKIWRADIMGNRIKNWIYFYSFFGESADEYFQHCFFDSIEKQAKHLSRAVSKEKNGEQIFLALQGLAFAGISLKDREGWIEQAFDLMKIEADKQILSDGMHISRNPVLLFEIVSIFVELKSALITAKYPVPVWLQHNLDRMVPALRFFIYQDKNLAHFNGGRYIRPDSINHVLSQANIRAKTLRTLPHSGYERVVAGRGMVLMDVGNTPHDPYDGTAHVAPLSFEYSYGKDRIIVNCGQHGSDNAWQNMLRGTAAHSTLTIDNRNAFEISNDGNIGRRASNISTDRQDHEIGTIIEGSHDGYLSVNGIIHRRSIFLNNEGDQLKGEENLTCVTGLSKEVEISLRFHIHPNADVSMTRSGEEILIRISGSKSGYRFKVWETSMAHCKLKLEDSIYLHKDSEIAKSKQIVVSAMMRNDHESILWSIEQEKN